MWTLSATPKKRRLHGWRRRCAGSGAAVAVAICLLTLVMPPAGAADIVGPARVVDGDTLEIAGEKIRLHGVDAPESDQYCTVAAFEYPCGVMATAWLVEATLGRELHCEVVTRDRWGRIVALCTVDGRSLNEMIVTAGWAVAFRKYSRQFEAQEADARRGGRGVWQGPFVFPVAWRRGDREQRLYALDDACPVKGNVTGSGERIYHVEGGASYERLQINPGQGDRCFETVAEAADAGFRPAGR